MTVMQIGTKTMRFTDILLLSIPDIQTPYSGKESTIVA
jgi:hypothetical protein